LVAEGSTFYPFEFTGIYSGYPIARNNIQYTGSQATATVSFGGLVESFVFNSDVNPTSISYSASSSYSYYTFQQSVGTWFNAPGLMAGTSSDAGSVDAQVYQGEIPDIFQDEDIAAMGPQFNYFPTQASSNVVSVPFAMTDGGYSSNTPIISLIARGVTKIVAFMQTYVPLASASQYNPATDGYVPETVDFMIPAWFGLNVEAQVKTAFYLIPAAIFQTSQYASFVSAMQQSQAAQQGAYVRQTLTTIANPYYGIPAGIQVDLCLFYTSTSTTWQNQLASDIQSDIALGANGPYANFPYYATSFQNEMEFTEYTPAQINLAAALSSWMILQHIDDVIDIAQAQ